MIKKIKTSVWMGALSLGVGGCVTSYDIKNDQLQDRVTACSAGFSKDAIASLQACFNKTSLEGQVSADVKEEARSIIFSELPEKDRLVAYEDYIKCIEGDWNKENYFRKSRKNIKKG